MKVFKFRYQTLLEVRERQQKVEEELLAHLVRQQRELEADLARMRGDEAAQHAAWLESQAAGALDLDEVVMIQQFLYVLETRIRVQSRAVEEAVAHVGNQREITTEAMRQTEIIQQLKTRDERAWREAVEKAEAAELDELATLRHARKPGPI